MIVVEKPVYYCEYCKRHRLTPKAILRHEPRCIYNPARSVCGWHTDTRPSAAADFAAVFLDDPDVEWLSKQMGGCPSCMMAVVVQARRMGLSDEDAWAFDYHTAVDAYRKDEAYRDAVGLTW